MDFDSIVSELFDRIGKIAKSIPNNIVIDKDKSNSNKLSLSRDGKIFTIEIYPPDTVKNFNEKQIKSFGSKQTRAGGIPSIDDLYFRKHNIQYIGKCEVQPKIYGFNLLYKDDGKDKDWFVAQFSDNTIHGCKKGFALDKNDFLNKYEESLGPNSRYHSNIAHKLADDDITKCINYL